MNYGICSSISLIDHYFVQLPCHPSPAIVSIFIADPLNKSPPGHVLAMARRNQACKRITNRVVSHGRGPSVPWRLTVPDGCESLVDDALASMHTDPALNNSSIFKKCSPSNPPTAGPRAIVCHSASATLHSWSLRENQHWHWSRSRVAQHEEWVSYSYSLWKSPFSAGACAAGMDFARAALAPHVVLKRAQLGGGDPSFWTRQPWTLTWAPRRLPAAEHPAAASA